MTEMPDLFTARKADFDWCEGIIRKQSKSFYAAFSMLPDAKRKSVYAIYAFCREADDSVDVAASRARLLRLRGELDSFLAGDTPQTPIWRALEVVFPAFGLSSKPFYDMLAGQEGDLAFSQPETMLELENYCYYVAGSVGLMLLPVLCHQAEHQSVLEEPAISLGVAMQLTNILRDVGEDLENGRVYLPASLMRAEGYTADKLEAQVVDFSFVALWEALAVRAERLYADMEDNILLLDEDSRLPTLSALYLYRDILPQVRAGGYDCFGERAFVPAGEKKRLAMQAQNLLAQAAREAGYKEKASV